MNEQTKNRNGLLIKIITAFLITLAVLTLCSFGCESYVKQKNANAIETCGEILTAYTTNEQPRLIARYNVNGQEYIVEGNIQDPQLSLANFHEHNAISVFYDGTKPAAAGFSHNLYNSTTLKGNIAGFGFFVLIVYVAAIVLQDELAKSKAKKAHQKEDAAIEKTNEAEEKQ